MGIAKKRKIPAGYTKYSWKLKLAQMLETDLVAVKRTSRSKPKKQLEMMQSTTKWSDLPLDLKCEILSTVIYMDKKLLRGSPTDNYEARKILARERCKNAVDRSRGKLFGITMVGFCDGALLEYVADRSPKLSFLEIEDPDSSVRSLSKALEKLPKLEELSIRSAYLQVDQALFSYCPELKTLRLNRCGNIGDKEIIAISENLRELRHLEMRWNYYLSNTGLQAILDGCPRLEVLDLQVCPYVDLTGDIGERLKQIKYVLHTKY